MSTSPHSKDLRKRVINFLKEGSSYKECAKVFALSIATIGRWYRRYKQSFTYLESSEEKRIDY